MTLTFSLTPILLLADSTYLCAENVDQFNTNWSKTAESTLVIVACNGENTGNASRYCNSEGQWEEPNYSNCISKSIKTYKSASVIGKEKTEIVLYQDETVKVIWESCCPPFYHLQLFFHLNSSWGYLLLVILTNHFYETNIILFNITFPI